MHTFMLAMLLYPDVQARARAEIEKVLGPHRLPTFDDLGSIPYVDALIKETLRWHPIVPLGMCLHSVFCVLRAECRSLMELNHVRLEDLPHKLREDDVYRGYHLEKDSLVMVNIWCVLSPSPRPSSFSPLRGTRALTSELFS